MPSFCLRSFRLQPRDIAVLEELSGSHFATRKNLALSCFDGSYQAAKKRLQKLIGLGFILEKRPSRFDVAILRISRKGAALLPVPQNGTGQTSGSAFRMPRLFGRTREHETSILDVRAAFISSVQMQPKLTLLEFEMSRPSTAFFVRCDNHGKTETVRPDAFMVVKESSGSGWDQGFFLEIDRSTESQSRLVHLAKLYLEYFRTGGFARKRGTIPLNRADRPMRVLIIFDSRKRLANAARRFLEETRVKTLIWLAAKEDVIGDPLGAIWKCPEDFGTGKNGAEKRCLFQND